MSEEPHRRRGDNFLCWMAERGSQLFDWIDKRQIDAWAVLTFSLAMTWIVLDWAMDFADNHADKEGLQIAAILGAVIAPWVTMQGALIKFYFDARKGSFEGKP